jgi:hypothetical protein
MLLGPGVVRGRVCCEQGPMLLGLACRQGPTQPWIWIHNQTQSHYNFFKIYIYIYIYIYILKIISKYQKNINVKLKKIKKISILSHVGQQYPTLFKYLLECHFQAFLVLCKPAGSRSKKALDLARGKTQRWWVLQGWWVQLQQNLNLF